MPLTHLPDTVLQDSNALDEPSEFFDRDLVVWRIAGIDIGAAQQLEVALREALFARPRLDEFGGEPFGLAAQEVRLVTLRAVQAQNEQRAVIQALGRLVEKKCRCGSASKAGPR